MLKRFCSRLVAGFGVLVLASSGTVSGQAVDLIPAADLPQASAPSLSALQTALAPYQEFDWEPKTPAERTLIPYAWLQAKKAETARRSPYTAVDGAADAFVQRGFEALAQARQGRVLRATPGTLTELAYVTANDHTVQPYYLYLPKDYRPDRRWPLLVFLHGYVPTISVLDPWVLGADSYATADRHGFAFLTPYGRRNTDFQGVGEEDVEETIREVEALYAIDPERVHLTGVSMGGAGCYYIGLRRPGRFASHSAMDGQTDMHAWWPLILPNWPASRDGIPPFRRWLVEWDNPVDLVMNARGQRFFVLHGERDPLVPVAQSRTFVKMAQELGIEITYYEAPGAGHYIYWEPEIFEKAWSWQKAFQRPSGPRRITYKTFSLEYDRAFWCRIADFVEWGPPAILDASLDETGRVLTATTSNIRRLSLDPGTAPLADRESLKAVINGRERAVTRAADGALEIVCDDTPVPTATWPPRKRHGLCGPVEEVFDTPFVVVSGTAGDDAEDRRLAAQVEAWATDWDRFADGRPPVHLDTQITDEVIARRSLVLFGTPASNTVLARLHARLPIRIGDHRFEVAGKTYAGPDLGLVMCYPNPLNPERYVVIHAGETYGEKCGINHKHDLLPDFLVFNTRQFNYDDTNQHEVAGFFDMNWSLAPGLTWVRQP